MIDVTVLQRGDTLTVFNRNFGGSQPIQPGTRLMSSNVTVPSNGRVIVAIYATTSLYAENSLTLEVSLEHSESVLRQFPLTGHFVPPSPTLGRGLKTTDWKPLPPCGCSGGRTFGAI